jgi:MFS family permease
MQRPSVPVPLREVLGNGAIVRVEAAWVAAVAAEWAYLVSLLVFAYGAGGVAAAGLVTTVRMLPPAVLAPFIATIADRIAPNRVLAAIQAARAVTVASGAVVILAGLPPAWIFAVAGLEGLLAVLKRPTTMALLPALARSPEQLVASNAVTSTGEAAGVLLGPAIGALLLAIGGVGLGFAVPAAAFAMASVIVATIGTPMIPMGTAATTTGAGAALRSLLGGFGALRGYPSAGLLVGLFATQTFVRGLLTVLLVAAAIELLGLGQAGVGYLNSAIGAGGLVGAVGVMAVVGRRRMGGAVSFALAGWGLPIAIVGIAPVTWLAFPLLGVVGVANAVLDVSGFTLLQRLVPNALRARVFGALEGIVALTFGLGSLVAAPLVGLLGLRAALVVAGALLPALAIVSAAAVRSADAAGVVPHRQVDLLRGIPLFAPLSMVVIERLARSLEPIRHEAGTSVIVQGEAGDAYYIVSSGRADVVHDGATIAEVAAGDGFGEIALLDDRPRTASIVVREALEGYRLPREAFLEAVTGSPLSARAGARLVAERLAGMGH